MRLGTELVGIDIEGPIICMARQERLKVLPGEKGLGATALMALPRVTLQKQVQRRVTAIEG